MKKVLIIIGISLNLLMFNSQNSFSQVVVKLKPKTPVMMKVHPRATRHGVVWLEGQWRWNRSTNKYVWVQGHWVKKKKGHKQIPGRWARVHGGYKWIPIRWKRI